MRFNADRLSSLRTSLMDWSDLPLRGALATTFIAHGYEKFFGGIGPFSQFLAGLGLPAPELMAWLAAGAEFIGGILIALGLLTRIAALAQAVDMVVAILFIHRFQGLMMHNVPDHATPAGYEWQLALFCIALSLILRGAGPFSLDYLIRRVWFKSMKEREARRAAPAGRAAVPISTAPAQSAQPSAPLAPPKREESHEPL